MNTKQLINGLEDIEKGVIPLECIIDMAPEIIRKLQDYKRLRAPSFMVKTKSFTEEIKELINAS